MTHQKNEVAFHVLARKGLHDILPSYQSKVQNAEFTIMMCVLYICRYTDFFGRTRKNLLMVVISGKRD